MLFCSGGVWLHPITFNIGVVDKEEIFIKVIFLDVEENTCFGF
jgi:hypothetical protein